MKKLCILLSVLLALGFANASRAYAVIEKTALTFILSNEAPGYLIDNLIADGYGDSSLYSVMVYLAPHSGGVIRQGFLDTLKNCPAGSEIFTAPLSAFKTEAYNPVGICSDGTLIIADIFGKNYYQKPGYSTYCNTSSQVELKIITTANSQEYYLDAGVRTVNNVKTVYKAFAIAWSRGSTIVISNEAPGNLIDTLIAKGYGNKNLFEVLSALQPVSGGSIPENYVKQLAALPKSSDIFTATLDNFPALNNPVCINADGRIGIRPIFAKDYDNKTDFKTHRDSLVATGPIAYTYTNKPELYIDAGARYSQNDTANYRAFTIIWSDGQKNDTDTTTALTFMLSNEAPGYLIDNLIANGYGDSSLYSVMVALQPVSGGVIRQSFLDTLKNCPAGSQIFSAPLSAFKFDTNNPVGINSDGTFVVAPIYGREFFSKQGYSTLYKSSEPVALKLFTSADSPEDYIDAAFRKNDNKITYYKAFAIAWSRGSTVVLSNEAPGRLIDTLVAHGYGNKNMYEVISALQPVSGGAIPESYVKQLAALPQSSVIFNATLNNYAGSTNQVSVNSTGRLAIVPIYAQDYANNSNFSVHRDTLIADRAVSFTYTNDPEHYVDAGAVSTVDTTRFRAFAIVWSDNVIGIPELPEEAVQIYPNPFDEGIYITNIETPAKVEIYDALGRVAFSASMEGSAFIELPALQAGAYCIKIIVGAKVYSKTLVKR